MVRTAFIAAFAAISLGATSAAAQTAPDVIVRQALEKHRESIEASTYLLYWIGACEPYVGSETTSFYLEQYAMSGSGKLDDFLNTFLGRLHLQSYIDGRRAREKSPTAQADCARIAKEAAAELKAAQDRVKE